MFRKIMTTTRMKRCSVILAIGLPFLALSAEAQDVRDTVESLPGIEVTTSVNVAEMYVGDIITYTVGIVYDTTLELIPPPLGANLGAFDVKDYQPDQVTELPDGRVRSETIFKLSTFTTGDYIIPPLPILFRLPDSTAKVILAEGLPIKVKSLLGDDDDTLDIKALKDPYEFERDYSRYYWFGGAGLLLLLAGIGLWLYLRKRGTEEEFVDLRPAWEIALEGLAILTEKHLPEEKQFKKFYLELATSRATSSAAWRGRSSAR